MGQGHAQVPYRHLQKTSHFWPWRIWRPTRSWSEWRKSRRGRDRIQNRCAGGGRFKVASFAYPFSRPRPNRTPSTHLSAHSERTPSTRAHRTPTVAHRAPFGHRTPNQGAGAGALDFGACAIGSTHVLDHPGHGSVANTAVHAKFPHAPRGEKTPTMCVCLSRQSCTQPPTRVSRRRRASRPDLRQPSAH
jgi:hypothetical protein